MKLTIRLRYHTRPGQSVYLCGLEPEPLPLHYANAESWEISRDFSRKKIPKKPANYYFVLREEGQPDLEDFGADRSLDFSVLSAERNLVIDSWNDLGDPRNVYFTEPFRDVLLRAGEKAAKQSASGSYLFKVKAPLLAEGQTLCLLGNFNNWNTTSPLVLKREHGWFSGWVDLAAPAFPIAYKYGVFDAVKNKFLRYEDGPNRELAEPAAEGRVVVNDGFARLGAAPWRGAGVAIPVFSLRSEKSLGVGEFLDLPMLADWARQAGLKLIQILPVNDTVSTHTWMDSYPYNAISAFALHPLYLNLDRLAADDRALLEEIAAQRKKLNALPAADYEGVMKTKLALARKVFERQHANTFDSEACRDFFRQNDRWLGPYAAFACLRDKFGTADFNRWPEFRTYSDKEIASLAARDAAARSEMDFHRFIQFHLHVQLREAAAYLHSHGIILKGDIAIGVAAHGADVWQQPELFHTNMQTGAPPDPFAAKGQNWGFPTYNWPKMIEDGFEWWKRRFAQMSHYFDAFRIDHILGFFRIWSIPIHAVEGILGYFVPARPVRPEDFAARGIAFDRKRFTQPLINDSVLREIFGKDAETAKTQFLNPPLRGVYPLKPEFATQRQVEDYFAQSPANEANARLKLGLFDLISNVLLIEEADGSQLFHFRFGMDQTPSFRQFDEETQRKLRELYIEYFYRWQDEGWRREAVPKLSAMKRVTNMLICGEDLGMVPACVPDVMKQLGLIALEVQRMPKALGAEFSRPLNAPYLTVVTPSTHDMSTIRGWWKEDRAIAQKFFNQELARPGEAPAECEPWIVQEVIRRHLNSPAIWSIFQLQDLLGMDQTLRRPDVEAERINIPAIPRYYWRFRMHLTLEKLVKQKKFAETVRTMARQAGRIE